MTPQQRELIVAYQTAFATEAGLRVLADLKAKGHVARCHVLPYGPVDRERLVFDESRRGLVLGIIANIETNLDEPKPTVAISQESF